MKLFPVSAFSSAYSLELVEAVHRGFASKAKAEAALNAVIDGIKTGIQKDGRVQIIGFGSFAVRTRRARAGRNPQTGEPINIKASKTIAFKVGQGFRSAL